MAGSVALRHEICFCPILVFASFRLSAFPPTDAFFARTLRLCIISFGNHTNPLVILSRCNTFRACHGAGSGRSRWSSCHNHKLNLSFSAFAVQIPCLSQACRAKPNAVSEAEESISSPPSALLPPRNMGVKGRARPFHTCMSWEISRPEPILYRRDKAPGPCYAFEIQSRYICCWTFLAQPCLRNLFRE